MIVDFAIFVGLQVEDISEILAMHGVDLARGLGLHHFKFNLNYSSPSWPLQSIESAPFYCTAQIHNHPCRVYDSIELTVYVHVCH